MARIPPFEPDGLLPPGDYEVSFDELRKSPLVLGPRDPKKSPSWDSRWRDELVRNLETLTRQLWQASTRCSPTVRLPRTRTTLMTSMDFLYAA
jgi:hypothetical protein